MGKIDPDDRLVSANAMLKVENRQLREKVADLERRNAELAKEVRELTVKVYLRPRPD